MDTAEESRSQVLDPHNHLRTVSTKNASSRHRPLNTETKNHPPRHYLQHFSQSGLWGPEADPSCQWTKWLVHTLDRSSVHHRADLWWQTGTLTLTPIQDKLESTISLTNMSLYCGRKLGNARMYWEACILHTERPLTDGDSKQEPSCCEATVLLNHRAAL